MKIHSIEIFNLNTTGVFYGQPVPKGCIGVVVDSVEFNEYRDIGCNVFIAECNGLVHCYLTNI